MSIVIEQDPDQARNSFLLHSRADLELIRLTEARATCAGRVADGGPSLHTHYGYSSLGAERQDSELFCISDFSFRVSARDGKEDLDVIVVECKFEAKYSLEEGYEPTETEVESFRRGNAIFNAWPFFREFVQNTVVRMGFPPPPVPFLRLAPRQREQAPAGTVTEPPVPNRKPLTRKRKKITEGD